MYNTGEDSIPEEVSHEKKDSDHYIIPLVCVPNK